MGRDVNMVELFVLKSATLNSSVQEFNDLSGVGGRISIEDDRTIGEFVAQFSMKNRKNAEDMSLYYQAFYLLENHIREIVVATLFDSAKDDWWDDCVPQPVKDEAVRNRNREESSGMRFRSDNLIDYITFGQLSDIIKENWGLFGGVFTNKSAVLRILSSLNSLRGPIAHCGVLPEDEIARLRISIRDWFYVAA